MRTLYVYLHTHWDREWYKPFEAFRTQLVPVVSSILQALESSQLPWFYLDGQAAILQDSTEISPQLTTSIQSLMKSGHLAAGPWYVLADEMLVSGESLIRNLQMGIRTTAEFGPASLIGYSPDTFGHTQDLPRILCGFGIKTAVVWRGVAKPESSPLFWWQSPDGSHVLTYFLSRGYYQTALHESKSPEQLRDFFLPWVGLSGTNSNTANTYCPAIQGALFPAGADHMSAPHQALQTLEAAQQALKAEAVEIVPIQLADFLQLCVNKVVDGQAKVSTISGELRDNRHCKTYERAYLLPGVLSTRLYLKRENRQSEHRLQAICEPLLTLLELEGRLSYPADELSHGWRLLMLNHPHDSICGCSVDEVHNEMQTRTQQLHQVLGILEKRARVALSGTSNKSLAYGDPQLQPNRLLLHNLSSQELSAPVPLTLHLEPGAELPSGDNFQLLSRQHNDHLFTGQDVVTYYKPVDQIRCLVWAPNVPPLGFQEIAWPPAAHPDDRKKKVRVGKRHLYNEHLLVEIDGSGDLIVTELTAGKTGKTYRLKHRLQDVGDGGDTYNFDPLAGDQPRQAEIKSVSIGKRGPLATSLKVIYQLDIPAVMEEPPTSNDTSTYMNSRRRSDKKIRHSIITEITLQRGSPIVFFDTTWENHSQDHRLEVVFDTGAPVAHTQSENHFSLVERLHNNFAPSALPVEAGCEAIPDRFPCQRFFIANKQVFLNNGLPEYAVSGTTISITLLRAVSQLSRSRLRTRGGGAGPSLAVPGANSLGTNQTSYAWAALSQNEPVQAYALAEQFEGRLFASLGRRESPEQSQSLLQLDNEAVKVTTLYYNPSSKRVFLRLLNPTAEKQETHLKINFPCREVALCRLDETLETQLFSLGAQTQPEAVRLPLTLRAHKLQTISIQV